MQTEENTQNSAQCPTTATDTLRGHELLRVRVEIWPARITKGCEGAEHNNVFRKYVYNQAKMYCNVCLKFVYFSLYSNMNFKIVNNSLNQHHAALVTNCFINTRFCKFANNQ